MATLQNALRAFDETASKEAGLFHEPAISDTLVPTLDSTRCRYAMSMYYLLKAAHEESQTLELPSSHDMSTILHEAMKAYHTGYAKRQFHHWQHHSCTDCVKHVNGESTLHPCRPSRSLLKPCPLQDEAVQVPMD